MTRTRILDAAERLFADRGYAGTSLRAITQEAEVNLASVHYHYGSKEGLLRAVTDRIVGPITERRRELLDETIEAVEPDVPSVEALVEAMVEAKGPTVAHFVGRTYAERTPWIQAMAEEQFAADRERFTALFGQALRHLSREELSWRLRRVVAIVVHLFATYPEEGMTEAEADATVARLVAFLAPALSAPAEGPGNDDAKEGQSTEDH